MRIEVRIAESEHDYSLWSGFCNKMPGSTAFHAIQWKDVLEKCFKVKPCYLIAVDEDSNCRGLLPLYYTDSIFTKPHVTSLENGILAEIPEAESALLNHAFDIRNDFGAYFLLIRGPVHEYMPDFHYDYVQPTLSLKPGLDSIWQNMKKKHRWCIRQSEKAGFRVRRTSAGIDHFYEIYTRDMKRLGTPVFAKEYLDSLNKSLGDRFVHHELIYKDRVAGGMICLTGNRGWTDYLATVRHDIKPLLGNYYLYWQVIRDACLDDAATFDMGRTVFDSTYHQYKRKWQGKDICLRYNFFYNPEYSSDIRNPVSHATGSPGLRHRLWARLPLFLCNFWGPHLRKKLPFG